MKDSARSSGPPCPAQIPLALYVHIPWCVRRCPYCDFNAHALSGELPVAAFIQALVADLRQEAPAAGGREVISIFFGGGTPSMLMPDSYELLLAEISQHCQLSKDVEITMEANPGTVERGNLAAYAAAGINRLSLGVQSFDSEALGKLGRIHTVNEAEIALAEAGAAGFASVNIDLMHGLPAQKEATATADLERALGFAYDHLSWYQLTIEPNTAFYRERPKLPVEKVLEEIEAKGLARLAAAGLERYEVSAYARPGHHCRHNMNYWLYGDYIGIGPGASGKLTSSDGRIIRRRKVRQPEHYMRVAGSEQVIVDEKEVSGHELAFEFLLNALRLPAGVNTELLTQRTGLELSVLEPWREQQVAAGLLRPDKLQTTPQGLRFLDELLSDVLV